MVGVVAGRVEDGDADEATRIDCCTCVSVRVSWRSTSDQGDGEARDMPFGCQTSARNFIDGGARG